MSERPEKVARYTVEQNGGDYTTSVPDLLVLFGRQQLTQRARLDIREALEGGGVGTEPDLYDVRRDDEIRLFLLERAPAPATTWATPKARNPLIPRTWKGWAGYAFAVFVVVAVLSGGSEDQPSSPEVAPAADTLSEPSVADARADRLAARRERVRKQRARRARIEARQDRARARRARAARRERRREQLALQAAPAAPEPQAVEPAVSNCHPSYDPCLDPSASDYDCAGGSGDGPEYTGYVTVKGADDYGLDSDGDGTGCES